MKADLIAVETSALMAIVLNEPDSYIFLDRLKRAAQASAPYP